MQSYVNLKVLHTSRVSTTLISSQTSGEFLFALKQEMGKLSILECLKGTVAREIKACMHVNRHTDSYNQSTYSFILRQFPTTNSFQIKTMNYKYISYT